MIWKFLLAQDDPTRDPKTLLEAAKLKALAEFGGDTPYLIDDWYVEDGIAHLAVFYCDEDDQDMVDLLEQEVFDEFYIKNVPHPSLPDGLTSIQYESFDFIVRQWRKHPEAVNKTMIERLQKIMWQEAAQNTEEIVGSSGGIRTWSWVNGTLGIRVELA